MEEIILKQLSNSRKNPCELLESHYDSYYKRLYNFFYFRIHNHHDAEALVEIVFEKIIKKQDAFEVSCAPFDVWLFTIARNSLIDFTRKTKLYEISEDICADSNPERDVLKNERDKILSDAIAILPEKETLRTKSFPHANEVSAPKVRYHRMRPVLITSCVCILLFGTLSTDFVQAAINNIKEFFYTEKVIKPEEVSNKGLGFEKKNNKMETPTKENTYSVNPKAEVSMEEAQGAFSRPLILPKLPCDIYSSSITNSSFDGNLLCVEFISEAFRLVLFDTLSPDGNDYIKYVIPVEEELTELKYTTRDVNIYSFDQIDGRCYLFTYDDFFYSYTAYEPLTNEEFIEIVDSLYQS